jgi:type VI secretion system secreted protein Hcp
MKTYLLKLFGVLCPLTFAIPMFGQSSAPTSTVFMNITGPDGPIQGEVTQAGREGWHRLQAYSHEIVSPRDPASGLPTGKRQHQPFRIVKLVNKASPLLLTALAKNDTLPQIDVSIWSPSQTGVEVRVLTYRLVNASVISIRPWMPNKADPVDPRIPSRRRDQFRV